MARIGRFIVLLYHDVYRGSLDQYGKIGRSATKYHISLDAFQSHLAAAYVGGLQPVGIDDLEGAYMGGSTSGLPGVLICFDDGWQGAILHAAEAMTERRIPGFFFVTSGFVGRRLFATPAELRALDATLHAIGSHGASHRMLSSLTTSAIREELVGSRKELEDITGRGIKALSVPGGAVDRRVVGEAREAGYEYVFTSRVAVNPTRGGALDIGRLGVSAATNFSTLERWLRFRLGPERVRRGILGIPKALLGMRTYSRVRRALLGEATGHDHVFEP